jgi:uncharacterized lipoprotein YddW (UPF0748 family)
MKESVPCRHRGRPHPGIVLFLAGAFMATAQAQGGDAARLLDVTLRMNTSPASVQVLGSLFETYSADRRALAGAALRVPSSGKPDDAADVSFFLIPTHETPSPGTTLAAALTATIPHESDRTTLRFRLTDRQMTIHRNGMMLATSPIDARQILGAKPRHLVWGRGRHGRFAGELFARSSNLDRPFLGAYMHLPRIVREHATNEERERSIDSALDQLRTAGFHVAMPYVTSTSGAAFYFSRVLGEQAFGAWDPLAHLIKSAHARGLDVYPVICVLASGHDEPQGILRTHPEWALRTPTGQPMGHICPAHPEARRWVVSVVQEVVERYPTAGILLDYLRFYNRPTRLDAASEARLHEYQSDHPGLSTTQAEQQFRELSLTQLASEISTSARTDRPDLQLAIYSWGPHVASNHRVAQAWPLWSHSGVVDMVNISGYCYPDNYGDKYLEVFSRRVGDAVKLNQKHHGRADITFCLGVATSHGRIQDASWIGDYLTLAAAQGTRGAAVFTWSRLVPHLDAVKDAGYLRRFATAVRGAYTSTESSSRNR